VKKEIFEESRRAEPHGPAARLQRSQPQTRLRSQRKLEPAWWAPSGFAAIPTAALDPAHSPASPAVPALDLGPGPHRRRKPLFGLGGLCRRDLGDGLELTEKLRMILRQVAHDPGVPDQLADVGLDHGQM
jgi:hypothetical protein